MTRHLLAAAFLCLIDTGGAHAASRPAEPGCVWQPFESRELGIRLLVQDCTHPGAKYVFAARDGWLEQHRPADDRTFNSPRVLRVLSKPDDQPIEAAIRRQFVDRLADRQARASCKVTRNNETAAKGRGKLVYEIVPTGAYERKILRELQKEPRDFGCGDYGKGQSTVYFEYHPNESKSRYLWVDAGQDSPLFDEDSIEFLPP